MKIKIANENYVVREDGRLSPLPAWAWIDRPWLVIGAGRTRHFRTHAAAIRWADEQARNRAKK